MEEAGSAANRTPPNTGDEMAQKVLLAWSSGKDSAWALNCLKQDPNVEVVGLLTTINAEFERVAMHAVRRELLERQIDAAGADPWIVEIPHPCSNEQYEEAMGRTIHRAREAGIASVAFGDLFLQDVREYRERQLDGSGVAPLFRLWLRDTTELAQVMLAAGLRARLTCVDPRVLDPSFAGREWDAAFLDDLPAGIDPCGENGEFHTFVYDGPMFAHPIPVVLGEVVRRGGFVFADLLPAEGTAGIRNVRHR